MITLKDLKWDITLSFSDREELIDYVKTNLIRFHYFKYLFIEENWEIIEKLNIKDLIVIETKRIIELETLFQNDIWKMNRVNTQVQEDLFIEDKPLKINFEKIVFEDDNMF